ncbi:HSP20-like chaperone [Truncatella angustata]|uniref:HSP20-like chaperone n=1 Tax=Truncatella angustata TaxID=152316 RepID=A0A9P9A3E6_9PEZI|nr:HSP20-like chaperone [Truncatella angustata]KAH6660078.1 HSP20-like chaperone [Truncatella angustata]
MANNNNNNHNNTHGQHPFWDFVQSFDANGQQGTGAGVDHAASGPSPGPGFGFPFGGPGGFNPWAGGGGWEGPWGPPGNFFSPRGGRHGRHGGRHGQHHHRPGTPGSDEESGDSEGHDFDMEDSPDTLRDDAPRGPPHPPPGGSHMGDHPHPPPPPHSGPRHHGRHARHGPGHGGPGPFGRGGCRGRGGPRGRHGPPGPPPPFPGFNGSFDLRPLMQALSGHPAAQALREYFDRTTSREDGSAERSGDQDETFVPPVDIFSTEKAYVLHISLPGAVKEDVGVNWDADKSQLNVAGVIYRPGDEQFLQSLTSSERKVGMFERSIKLPPADSNEKEEVDGFGITAKMENGILIVTVPKAEKEWTEIHKVDIQ